MSATAELGVRAPRPTDLATPRRTKTILVTGGTGALGGAVTTRLLDEGHRVATTWLVESETQALVDDASLLPVRADVTDEGAVNAAVAQVRRRFGPIDGLVHLVGAWGGGSPTHEHAPDLWHKMLAVNLTSAFLCCRAVLPEMIERDHGRIVLVSSRTAHAERSGQVGYAVAKSGVEVLAHTIGEENRGRDVTANVVAPSTIDTPANRRTMPAADPDRWVSLDEVTASICFLLDDAARALRGATLPLYGGV